MYKSNIFYRNRSDKQFQKLLCISKIYGGNTSIYINGLKNENKENWISQMSYTVINLNQILKLVLSKKRIV